MLGWAINMPKTRTGVICHIPAPRQLCLKVEWMAKQGDVSCSETPQTVWTDHRPDSLGSYFSIQIDFRVNQIQPYFF